MKMKSKLISIILMLLVLVSVTVSVSASADTTVGLKASHETGFVKPGDTITVVIEMTKNPGLTYAKLDIAWDTKVLTLQGVAEDRTVKVEGSAFADVKAYVQPKPVTGVLSINIGKQTALAGIGDVYTQTGKIMELEFLVNEGFNADAKTVVEVRTVPLNFLDKEFKAGCEVEAENAELIGHTACTIEDIPETPATCTEDGLTAGKKCSVCGTVTVAQEKIPALKHNWKWVVDVQPTVNSTGKGHYYCTRCNGTAGMGTTIDKLTCTHSMTKTDEVKATCTTEGKKEFWTCSVCNRIFADEAGTKVTTEEELKIPATGHTEVAIPGVSATCTTDGKTEGTKCSVCGVVLVDQTDVPAFGHTEVSVAAKAPTCTETGLSEGKKCSVCNTVTVEQKEVAATGHNFGAWEVSKKATTKEAGEQKRTCANCDMVETQAIPMLEPAISTPILIALIILVVACACVIIILIVRKKKTV